ncbi:MAG: hypothetical protein Q9170_006179 [Blastenia crenularia]
MPSIPIFQHRLQGFVLLLIVVLVLLFSSHSSPNETDHDSFRGPTTVKTVPALDIITSTSTIKGFASHLRRQEHIDNVSSSTYHLPLIKRINPPTGYVRLVCEGDKYLTEIKAAFDGKTPGKQFPLKELDNGWTKTTTADDTELTRVEARWKTAFEGLFGQMKGYPPRSEIKPVNLIQEKAYTTLLDKHVDKPTNAYSYALYYPSRSLMMSTSSYSAATRIERDNPGITKENRDTLLPTISSLSDLMWLSWNTVSTDPKSLRYIAIDNVFNDHTLAIMNYLFLREKSQTRNVPWPGLEFRGDSEEGKALLASPNGRVAGWLLIDHTQELKGKNEITLRQLKVNIFSFLGDFCMLWDLEPQSPRKRSLVGSHLGDHIGLYAKHASNGDSDYKIHEGGLLYDAYTRHLSQANVKHYDKPARLNLRAFNESLVKRDPAADFQTALCTGQAMWAKVQSAFDGHGDPVQTFLPSTLKNGWSRIDEKEALDSKWQQYFDLKLGPGKIPPADQVSLVRLSQNLDFVNSQGATVKSYSGLGAGTAHNYAYYAPSISAVVMQDTESPANVVKDLYSMMEQAPPSNRDIVNYHTPPLSRWSDLTWTVYENISQDSKSLRYIGRNSIMNEATIGIAFYIFDRHRPDPRRRFSAPFPGLEFGMDSPEGQALLGTPNGMGTGWLLIDRSRELGRRNPMVRIWTEGGLLMMAWDMAPV